MNRSNLAVKDFKLANWVKVSLTDAQVEMLKQNPSVVAMEKNIKLKIQTNFEVFDPVQRQIIAEMAWNERQMGLFSPRGEDNPAFPDSGSGGSGADPLYNDQWGMVDNDVKGAWQNSGTKGDQEVIVAVLDTGVDYTHEDLVDNMWQNPGETGLDANGVDKRTNGIDDDGNGYIDDVHGIDTLDRKSGAATGDPMDTHNHGTHVSGTIAAK
ncbi:MAG: S8 family serine peptidase, partial [Bdellovibrionales bacterium]|nr:S8 family serine peptidase [Bdellovibrionales bacterium]